MITQNPSTEQVFCLQTLPVNLLLEDYVDILEKRGITLAGDYIRGNVRRLTADEATKFLGYPAKSGGLLFQGWGGTAQFKPDEPWGSDSGDGKVNKPKYRTATGKPYDAIYPVSGFTWENPYWKNIEELKRCAVQIDGVPYLLITEGAFKAIAGCANDIPTIGLLGVEMGLTPGTDKNTGKKVKRTLIPSLKHFASAGFGFIIAFDADCVTNKNVEKAQQTLAKHLTLAGSSVLIATGLWTVEQGKGMDDYIQQNGADKFRSEILDKERLIRQWEKQNNLSELAEGDMIKSPVDLGELLANDLRVGYKYHHEQQCWRWYDGKIWKKCSSELFESLIYNSLREKENVKLSTPAQWEGAIKVLRNKLIVPEWITLNPRQFIAFNDCVYNLETRMAESYKPGFNFLSNLPYGYQPVDTKASLVKALAEYCPNIYAYMHKAMEGDESRIKLLLAIINGVIKYRFFDLQRFVYLLGKSGAGKGTFIRLLNKIVGETNNTVGKLFRISDDKFVASIIDKQLVSFSDERKKVGVEGLLELTGGDKIGYRDVYKPAASSYFYGTIIIASNTPIFVGDTTGIDRRLVLVNFNSSIPKELQSTKMEELYESEIPALVSVALTMDDDDVTVTIKGINDAEIPSTKLHEWSGKVRNNSLAAHHDEKVVRIEGKEFKTYIGNGKKDKQDGFDTFTLYGNYLEFCKNSGLESQKLQTFSEDYLTLWIDSLGYKVEKRRDAKGSYIIGEVRLREDDLDGDILPLSYQLEFAAMAASNKTKNIQPPSESTQSTQPLPDKDYRSTQESTLGLHEVYTDDIPNDETEIKDEPKNDDQCRPECTPNVDLSVDLKALPAKDSVDYVDLGRENFFTSSSFNENDVATYCGDNPDIWGERVLVKEVLSKDTVAVGVIGGFGKSKHFNCSINDLTPLPSTKTTERQQETS